MKSSEFYVGCIYEDCRFHPVECTAVSVEFDELQGKSLVDGSWPSSCSIANCDPILLNSQQARWITEHWDQYRSRRENGQDPSEILPTDLRGGANS